MKATCILYFYFSYQHLATSRSSFQLIDPSMGLDSIERGRIAHRYLILPHMGFSPPLRRNNASILGPLPACGEVPTPFRLMREDVNWERYWQCSSQ